LANCKQPPLCMRCEGGHLHKECPEYEKYSIDTDHAATVSWWTERNLIPPTVEDARTPRKRCEREGRRERPRLQGEGCSLPATPPQHYSSRQYYAATHGNSSSLSCPHSVAQACLTRVGVMKAAPFREA
jgi:hypothetical protein